MEKELNYLLQWKEKEAKELHACQFPCQNKILQDVKKQLQDMHEKFNTLKDEFVYNLGISEERVRIRTLCCHSHSPESI